MPARVAFVENNLGWTIVDGIMDILFLCDIVVNFFSVYFDRHDNLVTDRKVKFSFSYQFLIVYYRGLQFII